MSHSSQTHSKDKPARTTRKPLGPRAQTPPGTPTGIATKNINAASKENRQNKQQKDKVPEQRRSRILMDVTSRSQNAENISTNEANKSKESGNDSVRMRMMEWEKERQRLRDMEMLQDQLKEQEQEEESEHISEDEEQKRESDREPEQPEVQMECEMEKKPKKVLEYTLPKLSFDKSTTSTFSDGLLTAPLSPLMESK